MKTLKIFVVFGLMVLGLVLATVVQGQEPADNPAGGGVGAQGEIGATSLIDPPTTGKKVAYMFTGVQRNLSSSPTISTRVYCSNYGSGTVELKAQFFPADGGFGPTITKSLGRGKTKVFDIVGVDYDGFVTGNGSGRVLVDDSPGTKIICTVQVYHTAGIPGFIARLHLFDENGNLVGDDSSKNDGIFLPLIFKNS